MDPLDCQRCGGPNPADAVNCQWCGSTLPVRPLPVPVAVDRDRVPLLDSTTIEDRYEGRSLRENPLFRLVVIVLGIIVFVGFFATQAQTSTGPSSTTPVSSGPANPVNVTIIWLVSSDNVCDLNGHTEPGFEGVSNQVSGETWNISGPPGGCTVGNVNALTPGFTAIAYLALPLTVPPNGYGYLPVSFILPSGGYDGALNISIT